MRMRSLTLALLALLAAAPLGAQQVRGRVLDAKTGRPVGDVLVTVSTLRGRHVAQVRTQPGGSFTLKLFEGGVHRISASRLGYRATHVGVLVPERPATLEVDLLLSESRLELAPLTVTARVEPQRSRNLAATGFYEREREGGGRFIRREEVDRRRAPSTSDLIRGFLGSDLFIGHTPGTNDPIPRVQLRSQRQVTCTPRAFLDGVELAGGLRSLDSAILPQHVEAIEIYRGPSELPVRFAGAAAGCGAVVVWSRTG